MMVFLLLAGACISNAALGLLLPGLTAIRPALTSLAASGLVIIMIGAVVVSLLTAPAWMAAIPFVTGVLAAVVAVGRRQPAGRRLAHTAA
jgi:hypothetical protein